MPIQIALLGNAQGGRHTLFLNQSMKYNQRELMVGGQKSTNRHILQMVVKVTESEMQMFLYQFSCLNRNIRAAQLEPRARRKRLFVGCRWPPVICRRYGNIGLSQLLITSLGFKGSKPTTRAASPLPNFRPSIYMG